MTSPSLIYSFYFSYSFRYLRKSNISVLSPASKLSFTYRDRLIPNFYSSLPMAAQLNTFTSLLTVFSRPFTAGSI